MPTHCYWLAATNEAHVYLRRYTFSDDKKCPESPYWGHNAQSGVVSIIPWPITQESHTGAGLLPTPPWGRDHPKWPTVCGRCGYVFQDDDRWQVNQKQLFVNHANNERTTLAGAAPGAMHDQRWFPDNYRGADGIALVVLLPNHHEWRVDAPASGGGHWVRTGNPREPKTLSVTPSIAAGKPGSHEYYHGFLTNGVLTDHIG